MLTKENISKAAKEKITDIGGFLVDVKMNTNNNITIHFDKHEGVLIEDCISVTKHVESIFDRDVEDYELSVCSAGLSQPFKVSEQYLKNIGKEVSIKLKDGKRKSGVIKFFDENLTLEILKKKKGSKKDYIIEEIVIPIDQIKETKLKINFK
jgi:ribosome maturation factor RimP